MATKAVLEESLKEMRRRLLLEKEKNQRLVEQHKVRLKLAGAKGVSVRGAAVNGHFTFARDRAKKGWGKQMPEWVAALASACDATSQVQMGKALGVSATFISLVLKNAYPGHVDRIEALFNAWRSSGD